MYKILFSILIVTVAFVLSPIFERIAKKLKIQRIILELGLGILIGSTPLLAVINNSYLGTIAIIGAVVLLFSVGYGSKVENLVKESRHIIFLATAGVIIPFVAVYLASIAFGITTISALFVAAASVSTSVGISARILFDSHNCNTDIGNIILGASVLDDVYGLVLLSALLAYFYKDDGNLLFVVSAITLLGIIFIASLFAKKIIVRKVKSRVLVMTALAPIILSLPFVAGFLGLTPITGAYFSGLVASKELNNKMKKVLKFLYATLVPLFFIYAGTKIGLQTLLNPWVLAFGICLFLAVLVGQLSAGLSLSPSLGLRKGLVTGFGMLPRGEVALYISVTALGLNIITKDQFGAIAVMILLCTIVVSTLLKRFVGSACKIES